MSILPIILLILKITGITLLCVICAVLAILLLALFMPIGYRITAVKKDDKAFARVNFSWLWIVIRGYFSYENEVKGNIKALWITLYEFAPAEKKAEKPINQQSLSEQKKPTEGHTEKKSVSAGTKHKESSAKEQGKLSKSTQDVVEDKPKKQNIFQKFKYTMQKLYDKIRSVIFDKNNEERKASKLELLRDESARRAVFNIIVSVKKLILHLLPRHGNAYFDLGFDDPSLTGQVLGAYSMLLPKIGKRIHLSTFFDREVFEADINMRGHAQLFVVLYLFLKVWFNKDFRYLKERL